MIAVIASTPYQSLTLPARETKLHTSMKPAVVGIG
jgi:hypothetical protein